MTLPIPTACSTCGGFAGHHDPVAHGDVPDQHPETGRGQCCGHHTRCDGCVLSALQHAELVQA